MDAIIEGRFPEDMKLECSGYRFAMGTPFTTGQLWQRILEKTDPEDLPKLAEDEGFKRFELTDVQWGIRTWENWETHYGGEAQIIAPVEWDKLAPKPAFEYVWTVVDCDGLLFITPGAALVNRMHYVVAQEPRQLPLEKIPEYLYE